VLDYLRTGSFDVRLPVRYHAHDPEVVGSGDYIGLNYYSHLTSGIQLDPKEFFSNRPRPDDVMTDMFYAVYPEGFYRALQSVGQLGLPVYVTENGIADDRDDRRADFIRRYLYAMRRAMDDGVDVRGYYYWTLMDNFEWAEGWQMKFGLYALDRSTQVRSLREGSWALTEVIRRSADEPAG